MGLTRGEKFAILSKQNKVGRFRLTHLPQWSEGVNMEKDAGLVLAVLLCVYADAFLVSAFVTIWRCCVISNTAHQINEEIRDKEVRLISATGEQLGIMPTAQAMEKATAEDLDLVKISPNATPPVCKLMDYGKFRFEQTKREKEAKKNQRIVEIKEVRMSPGIDVNDFNVKLRNAQRFLAEGNRVKVTVRFRGREMAHTDIGKRLLQRFAEDCSEMAAMDKEPKLEGRHMHMFLSPKAVKKDEK